MKKFLKRFSPKQMFVYTIILYLVYVLLELFDVFPAGNASNVFLVMLLFAVLICEWVHTSPKKGK